MAAASDEHFRSSAWINRSLVDVPGVKADLRSQYTLPYRCRRLIKIDNNLWCVEDGTNKINICSMEGRTVKTLHVTTAGNCLCRALIRVWPDGLVLGTTNGLYTIDMNGRVQSRLLNGHICDVSFYDNTLCALDFKLGEVYVFKLDGRQREISHSSKFALAGYNRKSCYTMQVTAHHIYIAQCYHCTPCIQQYTRDGGCIATHQSTGSDVIQLQLPWLCGVDAQGSLLVADRGKHCLLILRKDADWLRINVSGLDRPTNAIIDNAVLVILENYKKIKTFSLI